MHARLRIFFGVATLLALPALASAQSARVEGMAVPGDYIKDYTAIYGWPSSLTSVGNLVYGELGNALSNSSTGQPETLDRSVGAVLGNLWDGNLGTWGIHFREQQPGLGQADAFSQLNPGSGGGDPNAHTNESFDIMWAKKFGGMSLGLRFNRSFFEAEDELPGVTTTLRFDVPGNNGQNLARNVTGIGAGVGFEMNPETQVELALLYQSRTYENIQSPTFKQEDDGGTNYLFQGRAMWKWTSNVMVMPVAKFYSFDLSERQVAGTTVTAFENTLKGWQVGLAGNWTLGSNDLFVLGFQVAQNKLDQQEDLFNLVGPILPGGGPATVGAFSDSLEVTETMAPQAFAALETHVNSWLTLRFGANKGVMHSFKVKDKTRTQTLTIKDSPFSMNIGAGVKLGTLQLDAILDTFFPHNPFAQLMGGTRSTFANSPFAFPKVTATYSF